MWIQSKGKNSCIYDTPLLIKLKRNVVAMSIENTILKIGHETF